MRRYKEDLDLQRQNKQAFQMFGNMTQHEKRINKEELKAYKEYDNIQYGLVPGINHEKKYPSTTKALNASRLESP
jgi:hypothetical protein